jgi:hypothetical protein
MDHFVLAGVDLDNMLQLTHCQLGLSIVAYLLLTIGMACLGLSIPFSIQFLYPDTIYSITLTESKSCGY